MARIEYSRAGNFSLTSNGNLVTANGLNVMGYPAVNGVVNTNAPLGADQYSSGPGRAATSHHNREHDHES